MRKQRSYGRRAIIRGKPRSLQKAALLAVLLTFILPTVLSGITSRIVDESGKGISGASISDNRKWVTSNRDGRFSINTSADSLYISRLGYHRLAVNTRHVPTVITLSTNPIAMPTVFVRAMEYRPVSPSLSAQIIHPDTNERVQSANDLLLKDASFNTADQRLSGERQTVSLLGGFSRHSLIMMDGVVLNSAGEAFDFSKIPLGQIDHIEVIKGNSSVYGGSAAIGGIIHIHTKNAGKPSLWDAQVSVSAGSFASWRQVYEASYTGPRFTARAEYTHQAARNDFEYDTPAFWGTEPHLKRMHNQKTADAVFARGSYYFQDARVEYSLNTGSFVRQLPGPINFLELYDSSRLTGSYAMHSLRAVLVKAAFEHELLAWMNQDESRYQNLHSTNPFGLSHYTQKQLSRGGKLQSGWNREDLKLNAAAEFNRVDYEFQNNISDSVTTGERETTSLSLRGMKYMYPGLFEYRLTGAVRGDYTDTRLHPTWRIEQELSLPTAFHLAFGGYVGTAYSQPSLFDMYWIGDSETQGNPDLKSESSIGFNAYAAAETQALKLRAAYYRNWVENLIQWRQYYLNGMSWKPFNVGRAEVSNYELESSLNLLDVLQINGSITLTSAIDKSTQEDGSPAPSYNKKLVYTPSLKGVIGISYASTTHGASISYGITGQQFSTPDNLIDPLPAYDNLDVAAFYRISLGIFSLQSDLKVNNILDTRYDIYAYTPQPGRNWTLGVSVSTGGAIANTQEPNPKFKR